MGLNQLLTAARRPPHLKAIFPIVPMADGYRDITFSGGQLNASFIPLWLGLVTAGALTPAPSANDPLGALGGPAGPPRGRRQLPGADDRRRCHGWRRRFRRPVLEDPLAA